MVATKKFKAYVSDMTLRLGPITTSGSLIPVRTPVSKEKKSPFKMVTPSGGAVQQRYVDEAGELYEPSQLARGIEVDGVMKIVEATEAKQAKSSNLPKNVLNLVVHEAAEVDERTYPSDKNAYVFVPDTNDPANTQYADLLATMLGSDKALVGLASIRNVEGMYRMSLWRGNLVVQQYLYPEEINDHEVKPPAESLLADKAMKLLDKLYVEFDPELYRDASADNIAAFVEANDGKVEPKSETSVLDIASALDAFLDS